MPSPDTNKTEKLSTQPHHIGAAALLSPLDPANEADLIRVLESSLYPGASPESIRLVIGYCRLNGHDPLKKPVHIVPMSVKMKVPNPSYKEGTASPRTVEQNVYRDVIMPGVGLYRTDASRAGNYMGLDAPEFGPTVEGQFGNIMVKYPEWCTMRAKKLVAGHVVEFVATEYWMENYATAGRDTVVPNAMWRKRPFGQLAKCTEAQVLRKGWPETVGSAPTADEMEGKSIDEDTLAELNAGQTALLVDSTRERTEKLKREIGVADTSKVIDVQPEPTKPPAETSGEAEPDGKEPPPGVPASVGETMTEKPAAATQKRATPSKAAPAADAQPAPAESDTQQVLPAAGDALVLEGITFPTQLRSSGIRDRIALDQYTLLQEEASRLGLDLADETQRLLGIAPDDLSKEAARVLYTYLQKRQK